MSRSLPLNIAALVSIGQHPASGRARRASQDARAVELGLELAGTDTRVVHAGAPNEAALRQYLGMGLPGLTLLSADPQADAVPTLADYFQHEPADIILAGVCAEGGEASGMLPYLLAEWLGWPIVPRIAGFRHINEHEAEVLQALPRGQRRALKVTLPFVATVDNAAPEPRQFAFGPGQRGQINAIEAPAMLDVERTQWQEKPAKPRPKRLSVTKAASAADRFKAATAKPQGQGGQILKQESDQEKAQAILDLLVAEGVVK